MINLNKKIAAVTLGAALAVTGLLGGLMLNNSAITASADENDVPACVAETASTEHTVTAPSVDGWDNNHNCMTVYNIKQNDAHSNTVYFYKDPTVLSPSFSYTYHKTSSDTVQGYVVTSSSSSTRCTAGSGRAFRAYCSTCGNYSSFCNTLMSTAAEAEYPTTGSKTSGTISTAYTTLACSADSASMYKFSIAYKGVIGDGKVVTNGATTSVTVDGVTFTVMGTASGIKIMASATVHCNAYDTMFAYYLIS